MGLQVLSERPCMGEKIDALQHKLLREEVC